MAAQTYTVYIPRLHSDTDESYIRWQFDYYNLAHVARVDWVFKYNDAGQLIFKQAFVHLMWMENDTAQRLKTKIDKSLLAKKSGWVKVEILVEDWSQDLQSLLNKAGLIDQTADQDGKVVKGTVRVEDLMKLAKLLYVNKIKPQTL